MSDKKATVAPPFRQVLVVEDDLVLARVLARNLERRNIAVRVVQSAEEAQQLVEKWHPDAIVLDIGLPGRTGWDLIRSLGAAGLTIPVIILTGGPIPHRRIDEFQPYACLPKPFPLEALIRLLTGEDAYSEDGIGNG